MKKNARQNTIEFSESISPENVEKLKLYAFTIAPMDAYQHFTCLNKPLSRLYEFREQVKTAVMSCKNCIINTHVELSQHGRLHLHGYITINDIASFYLVDIHIISTIGTYVIKELKDDKWEIYVTKQNFLNLGMVTNIPEEVKEFVKDNKLYKVLKRNSP